MLQTEFTFTLPCGYVDEQGTLHQQGLMRRATALDEVDAMGSARVRSNEAYLSIALLGKVIIRLGTLASVGSAVIESLFAPDFVYLQELYARVNGADEGIIETRCPTCGAALVLNLYADT